MKKATTVMNALFIALMAILILQTSCSSSVQKSPDKRDMVVWYNKPADREWLDGLFIGNGYMGGNVFGKVQNERIALNESSFWSGRPHDYNDPDAYKYFGKIKDLVFSDKFQEAEKMADEHFYGKPGAQQAYQPIGDLILDFNSTGDSIRDYHRELNMETGVVKVTYTEGNVKMTREVFMSYPDRVMVMKVSANKPGRISLEAKLRSPFLEKTTAKDGKLSMTGTWKYLPSTVSWLIAKVEGTGLNFQTSMVHFGA
jgi:alpha-L-fucosidase 2